jgi:hypothetical protein
MLALKGTHPLVTDWLGVRLGLGASRIALRCGLSWLCNDIDGHVVRGRRVRRTSARLLSERQSQY